MLANRKVTIENVRKRADRVRRRVTTSCRDISGLRDVGESVNRVDHNVRFPKFDPPGCAKTAGGNGMVGGRERAGPLAPITATEAD